MKTAGKHINKPIGGKPAKARPCAIPSMRKEEERVFRHIVPAFKCSIAIFLLILGVQKTQAQQTIQFSQYVFNGLAVNPAYTGYRDDWTISLSSRIQWVGINGAPQTNTLSFDGLTNADRKNMGLGIIATSDRIGPQSTTSIYANYAYRLRLDDDDTRRLSFGIALGAIQYSIDASKFNATDVGDGVVPSGDQSKLTPDVRFGVYYYSSSFYAGLSMLNALTGQGSFIDNPQVVKQDRHLYLTTGMLIPLSETLDLKPSIMLKEDFKGPTNLDLNSYILFNKVLWLGASYRTALKLWKKANLQSDLNQTDAVAAIVRLNINERFKIGYSYDFTVSSLASYQSGSHELSLSISFPGKRPRILTPRYF